MEAPAPFFAAYADWGTSSLRIYSPEAVPRLLHSDADGGVLRVKGGFSIALERALAAAGIGAGAVLVCGMASSSRGWMEVGYCAVPASASQLAWNSGILKSCAGRLVVLLPGVASTCNANGESDVMRGEETQCLGTPPSDEILVLPGTHSKWVRRNAGGDIIEHTSFMTGELFALLKGHSILSSSITTTTHAAQSDGALSAAFFKGLRLAAPLAGLFSARVKDVLALSEPARAVARAENGDFVSGALLALELREARAWLDTFFPVTAPRSRPRILIVGATPELSARYLAALRDGQWCDVSVAQGNETARGLAAIAPFAEEFVSERLCDTEVDPDSQPCTTQAHASSVGMSIESLYATRCARWRAAIAAAPLVAILRGVTPEEVAHVGGALAAAGTRVIEVPLNSPRPLESIRVLGAAMRTRGAFAPDVLVGAGTVLTREEVAAVADAGGEIILSPNADAAVIAEARQRGLVVVAGVSTATEAFAALAAGASALKLFPCTALSPDTVRALRAVLPRDVTLVAVGGVSAANCVAYRAAGADVFGLGTALYKPGCAAAAVGDAARSFLHVLSV